LVAKLAEKNKKQLESSCVAMKGCFISLGLFVFSVALRCGHVAGSQTTTKSTATGDKRPGFRLDDIVCAAGTTQITPPHYYKDNAAGWCASAVDETYNDVYNMAYREECRRWMGGALPDHVSATQLEYCFEYTNATVTYDIGLCCLGVLDSEVVRCFNGTLNDDYYNSYTDGSTNYRINYNGQDLVTCQSDEVCQTLYTFIASAGNIDDVTMTKGCNKKSDFDAIVANGTCVSCQVPVPQCARSCNTTFCNYDYYDDYYLKPSPCPTGGPPTYYACNSQPCQNGGICHDVYNTSTYYDFECHCKIKWNGTTCSQVRPQCATNQCLNGGTCYDYSDIAAGDFSCDCAPLFVGERCEITVNNTCNSSSEFSYKTYTEYTSSKNCTKLTWSVEPDDYTSANYYSYVKTMCGIQVNEATLNIKFEMKECDKGDYYTWMTYHWCCENRTQCASGNPCWNGGTCWDWSDDPNDPVRCDCPLGFVGDFCEIGSNLTCSSSDLTYLTYNDYYTYTAYGSYKCTKQAWYADGKPNNIESGLVDNECKNAVHRPSDGHHFEQGVDGQIKSDQLQFEMKSCDYGDGYSRCYHHMCCPSCLSSPCQNGGYCIQLTYNSFVCKCLFGFNGDYCQNRLASCKVSGDPHYRSFDALIYDYQGICKHDLASVCSDDSKVEKFNVYGRNEFRGGIYSVSYPRYVEIVYSSTTVRLESTGATQGVPVKALLNGTEVQIPYKNDDFELYYNGMNVHYVATCGLTVDFDGYWAVSVGVPGEYTGMMCGMCGNNDVLADNDLTLANGTYVGDEENGANIFGNSNVVDDPELNDTSICPAPPPPPPCNSTQYSSRCSVINNSTGIFSSCISKLPPGTADAYYEQCMLDACYTEGQSICSTVYVFNEECRSYGAQVSCSIWPPAVGCESTNTSGMCSPGMEFKCSVSACQPTCAQPNAPDSCSLPNVDACVCPSGQYLFNGSCTDQCPTGCPDENNQLQPIGSSWPVSDCSTATCVSCPECLPLKAELEITSNCLPGQICTNETCVDMQTPPGTATTTPPTTPSPAPDLFPDPYVRMTLNGSAYASNVIDSSCANSFSSEFRSSFQDVNSRANDAIKNGQLCVGLGKLSSAAGSIQLSTFGVDIRVTFWVAVGLETSDTVTIRGTELCAYEVSSFLQSFSNWRQPIIGNVYGCPSVTFSPSYFDLNADDWMCL